MRAGSEGGEGIRVRDHLANVRTLLAWTRLAVAILGVAYVIATLNLLSGPHGSYIGAAGVVGQRGFAGPILAADGAHQPAEDAVPVAADDHVPVLAGIRVRRRDAWQRAAAALADEAGRGNFGSLGDAASFISGSISMPCSSEAAAGRPETRRARGTPAPSAAPQNV